MLPPILRSKVLVAILHVLIVPLQYLFDQFTNHKNAIDRRLDISGNVQYLQKAMNDAFFLEDNQIYIITPEEEYRRTLYFESELQPPTMCYMASDGEPLYFWQPGDSTVKYNFVVMVPTFLCTSLIREEDEYEGTYLQKIIDILNTYKPAGRTYSIELYDYYYE